MSGALRVAALRATMVAVSLAAPLAMLAAHAPKDAPLDAPSDAPPVAPPATPPATPAPASETAPASPVPHTPAPSAPAVPPAPAIPTGTLDPKGLVPKLDALQDVQPGSATIARCQASVARAVPSLDVPVSWLSWRVDADSVALLARDDSDRTAVLAQLRWRGPVLEWHWARVSATSFAKAVREAERVLPWMTILVTQEGGSQIVMMAPPTRAQRSFRANGAFTTLVPGAVGRALVLGVDADPAWAVESAGANSLRLTCAAGAVLASLDQTGKVRAEIEPPGGFALAELRKLITERQQEMRRASPEERPIIEAEIAELRAKLVDLESRARVPSVPWPPMPTLRVHDSVGREFAVLDLKPETNEQRNP